MPILYVNSMVKRLKKNPPRTIPNLKKIFFNDFKKLYIESFILYVLQRLLDMHISRISRENEKWFCETFLARNATQERMLSMLAFFSVNIRSKPHTQKNGQKSCRVNLIKMVVCRLAHFSREREMVLRDISREKYGARNCENMSKILANFRSNLSKIRAIFKSKLLLCKH